MFFNSCYYHYHNDPNCPNYPSDPAKRFTKNGTSFHTEDKLFRMKIQIAKKKFPEIKKDSIMYQCQFNDLLKSEKSKWFTENILPNLYHFTRLCPRDANFGGMRQVFGRKWDENDAENDGRSLHFLDLNQAHSYVASTFSFPYGECRILIDDLLDDIEVHENCLISTSTNKQLCGLIKARILPSQFHEPFLPVRIESKDKKSSEVFHAICFKCLENRSQNPCTHSNTQREMNVTTTIESMNYALQHKFCDLIKIFEIWVSNQAPECFCNLIFKKTSISMILNDTIFRILKEKDLYSRNLLT